MRSRLKCEVGVWIARPTTATHRARSTPPRGQRRAGKGETVLGNHGAPRPPGSSPPPVNTVGDDIQVLTLNGVCGLAGDPGH